MLTRMLRNTIGMQMSKVNKNVRLTTSVQARDLTPIQWKDIWICMAHNLCCLRQSVITRKCGNVTITVCNTISAWL